MAQKLNTNRESQDLILYQLQEVQKTLDSMKGTIEIKHLAFENRLTIVERDQIKMQYELTGLLTEPKREKEDETNFDQLVKVILKFAGVIATALAIAYAVLNK